MDRLIKAPFDKRDVYESKRVASFMSNIFDKGLREDMPIFETKFVKKYPEFSGKYMDLYSKSNTNNSKNLDFLLSYDHIGKKKLFFNFIKKYSITEKMVKSFQTYRKKLHQRLLRPHFY